MRGLVVLPIAGEPAQLSYGVEVDADWRTRRAVVDVGCHGGDRSITFEADGEGRWMVDGARAEVLDGCIDIDLGFTPATNTLQIRRLGLGVGESRSLVVAWLRFPELTVEPLIQTYTHLSPGRWGYASGEFTAELAVDSRGYVLRYGNDLWTAIAHRPER